MNENFFVEITQSVLSDKSAVEFVSTNENGAIVLFQGVTRKNNMGRTVLKLDYEAYTPMAEKKMLEILLEAKRKWNISKCYVSHRIGTLYIGDVSMILCISSKHRKEAFEASQYFIDKLKEIVPIWKKEYFTDGYEWIGPVSYTHLTLPTKA